MLNSSHFREVPKRYALAGICAVYVVAQLLLFDSERYLEWDEAIYLAEVTPGELSIGMAAHRARGVTWIVAPAALLGMPLVMIRNYLTLLSSVSLLIAYSRWQYLGRARAALAAGIFAFSWPALFYGSEVSPNLYSALFSVACVGSFAHGLESTHRNSFVAAGLFLAAIAAVRPTDSLWVGLGLAGVSLGLAYWALCSWRTFATHLVCIAAGLGIGWAPWIAEAFVRFGDPKARFFQAASVVEGGFQMSLFEHLLLTDGGLMGPDVVRHVPIGGIIWWGALISLAVWGTICGSHGKRGPPLLAALVCGLTVAFPYLFLTGALAPRFLLPAYALLAVPVTHGFVELWENMGSARGWNRVRRVGLVSVLIVGALWHVHVAYKQGTIHVQWRQVSRHLALVLLRQANGEPCRFASQYGFPTIAFGSGCRGSRLMVSDAGALARLREEALAGERLFALTKMNALDKLDTRGWVANRLTGDAKNWVMLIPEETVDN